MTTWSTHCPWCQAEAGHSCRTSDGRLRVAHRARVRMARANAAEVFLRGEQAYDPAEGQR